MMRIVHISDTHGLHRNVSVPWGDVLVHSGDFTNRGEKHQVLDFIQWIIHNCMLNLKGWKLLNFYRYNYIWEFSKI